MEAEDNTRNYVLDNSRGYQTRGRSMGPGRGAFDARAAKNAVGAPEENLQLVPCRWSHTGWKYVQADPGATAFFTSPNRVNSFGFSSQKGRKLGSSVQGKEAAFVGDSEFQTSYSRFFNPSHRFFRFLYVAVEVIFLQRML